MLGEYGIKDILKVVYDLCLGKTSKKVYTTDRPRAVSEKMNDFTVVKLNSSFRDRGGYGNGFVGVLFYVRDKEGGTENLQRLHEMQSVLYGLFPCKEGRYYFGKPRILMTGNDNNGFHIYHFQIKLIIE